MRELSFVKLCNGLKLDGEIRATLGVKLIGVSTGANTRVHLDDTTTPQDDATVTTAVAAHDPTPVPDPVAVAVTAAKAEAGADPQTTALMNATPGQIGAWYDGLTAPQKSAVGRVAVIKLVEHEKRLRLIEKALGL